MTVSCVLILFLVYALEFNKNVARNRRYSKAFFKIFLVDFGVFENPHAIYATKYYNKL